MSTVHPSTQGALHAKIRMIKQPFWQNQKQYKKLPRSVAIHIWLASHPRDDVASQS